MPHSNMPPPSQPFTNMLMVKRIIRKGDSQGNRSSVDRQNVNKLGRNISPSSLASANNRGMSGIYTQYAYPISKVIAGLNSNSQQQAKAAAIQKERAEIKLRKEALLRQLLLNKQQQNAGYKKTKAKPKPKTKPKTKPKPKTKTKPKK